MNSNNDLVIYNRAPLRMPNQPRGVIALNNYIRNNLPSRVLNGNLTRFNTNFVGPIAQRNRFNQYGNTPWVNLNLNRNYSNNMMRSPFIANQRNFLPRNYNNFNQLRNFFGRSNFQAGGYVNNNITRTAPRSSPASQGFSLSNSGERNVSFGKEFVAGFLKSPGTTKNFNSFQITTHPSLNSQTVKISEMYQRYKILSYQFKYKAACSTNTPGMHYTGVDYGNQINIPANYEEAESLEHFAVGPIWADSQIWHILKMSNLKERWFSTMSNSNEADSRPARIIYGAIGKQESDTTVALGAIEVKVTYLFNGLGHSFTGTPKTGSEDGNLDDNDHHSTTSEYDKIVETDLSEQISSIKI
jgi:hypothetical protein